MLHFTAINDGRMTEAAKRQVAEEQDKRRQLFSHVLLYGCNIIFIDV